MLPSKSSPTVTPAAVFTTQVSLKHLEVRCIADNAYSAPTLLSPRLSFPLPNTARTARTALVSPSRLSPTQATPTSLLLVPQAVLHLRALPPVLPLLPLAPRLPLVQLLRPPLLASLSVPWVCWLVWPLCKMGEGMHKIGVVSHRDVNSRVYCSL
jgi:hypothetical protein